MLSAPVSEGRPLLPPTDSPGSATLLPGHHWGFLSPHSYYHVYKGHECWRGNNRAVGLQPGSRERPLYPRGCYSPLWDIVLCAPRTLSLFGPAACQLSAATSAWWGEQPRQPGWSQCSPGLWEREGTAGREGGRELSPTPEPPPETQLLAQIPIKSIVGLKG